MALDSNVLVSLGSGLGGGILVGTGVVVAILRRNHRGDTTPLLQQLVTDQKATTEAVGRLARDQERVNAAVVSTSNAVRALANSSQDTSKAVGDLAVQVGELTGYLKGRDALRG